MTQLPVLLVDSLSSLVDNRDSNAAPSNETSLPSPYSKQKQTRSNSVIMDEKLLAKKVSAMYRSLKKDTLEQLIHEDDQLQLGDEYVTRIASAMPQCKALKVVKLAQQNISAQGASALFEAMQTNCSIQHLNLDGNALKPLGIWHLALAMQKNENLSLVSLSLGCCAMDRGGCIGYLCEFLADCKVRFLLNGFFVLHFLQTPKHGSQDFFAFSLDTH